MKAALSAALASYREFRAAKAKNRAYRVVRYVSLVAGAAFLLLLTFPQILFAHEASHKNFKVYSREPLGQDIPTIYSIATLIFPH
jgi:hypothetical protein